MCRGLPCEAGCHPGASGVSRLLRSTLSHAGHGVLWPGAGGAPTRSKKGLRPSIALQPGRDLGRIYGRFELERLYTLAVIDSVRTGQVQKDAKARGLSVEQMREAYQERIARLRQGQNG